MQLVVAVTGAVVVILAGTAAVTLGIAEDSQLVCGAQERLHRALRASRPQVFACASAWLTLLRPLYK